MEGNTESEIIEIGKLENQGECQHKKVEKFVQKIEKNQNGT